MDNSNDTSRVRTVGDFLFGCVNFAVPDDAVIGIAKDRNFSVDDNADDIGKDSRRLMKADLYKWIVMGPGRITDTKDQDNGWAHAGGGYTLSEFDKKLMMNEANAIYAELEPESVFGKKKIRMRSAGIMPAYRDTDGTPLPRRPL